MSKLNNRNRAGLMFRILDFALLVCLSADLVLVLVLVGRPALEKAVLAAALTTLFFGVTTAVFALTQKNHRQLFAGLVAGLAPLLHFIAINL